MPNINKVPASAGAQWLLDAVALLRRQPLGLGLLGLAWGALSLLVLSSAALNPTLSLALQLGLALLGPFLFAGLLWAVREVDEGRPALPAHLFKGLELGRASSLLATLLPQAAAAMVLAVAFFVLLGGDSLKQIVEATEKIREVQESGGQPDPELVKDLPIGGIFLCMSLSLALAVAVTLAIFVAVPQIVFSGTRGLEALGNSLRAGLRNLPALGVYLLLLFVALMAITFAVNILALLAQLVVGVTAAILAANLLMMAVLMPLLAGTTYFAWKQLLQDGEESAPSQPPAQIEV